MNTANFEFGGFEKLLDVLIKIKIMQPFHE